MPEKHWFLDESIQDRARIHKLLDEIGIPSAMGAVCDNPECYSLLMHRVCWLIDLYKQATANAGDCPQPIEATK